MEDVPFSTILGTVVNFLQYIFFVSPAFFSRRLKLKTSYACFHGTHTVGKREHFAKFREEL